MKTLVTLLTFMLAITFGLNSFAATPKRSWKKASKKSAVASAKKPAKKKKKLKRVYISFDSKESQSQESDTPVQIAKSTETRPYVRPATVISDADVDFAGEPDVTYTKSVSIGGETIRYAPVKKKSVAFSASSSSGKTFQRILGVGSFVLSTAEGQYTNQADGLQPLNGLAGGLLVDIGFGSRHLVLETGVLFRRMGFGNEGRSKDTLQEEYNEYVTMDYLSLPVSAKYYFDLSRSFALFGKLGVAYSNLVQGRYEYYSRTREIDNNDLGNVESKEFGALAGLGARMDIGSNFEILGEATYYRGFTSLRPGFELYNSGFQFGGGIAYRL